MPKKRTTRQREPRQILHIFCEGEKTEPAYLRSYIQTIYPGQPGRKVVEIEATKKNTPVQLVDVAVAAKNSGQYMEGDHFWVVYDRESEAKYPHALHANARKKAKDHGVQIALSNVCFELWILLHFKPNSAPYTSCDNLLVTSDLKRELKKLGIANYDKGDTRLFDKIKGSISDARQRAKAMNQQTRNNAPATAIHEHQLNPWTDVHLLLDAIDNFKSSQN